MKPMEYFALAGVLIMLYACVPPEKSPEPIVIERGSFVKMAGRDCDKVDSEVHFCSKINLNWPVVKSGNKTLQRNVAQWSKVLLVGLLSFELSEKEAANTSLEKAAETFISSHDSFTEEAPDAPMGEWTAESTDTVLYNDGRYLTLQISGYVFTGGAHGNHPGVIATFDVATGKQLGWKDLITDEEQVKFIIEKQFRKERSEIFEEGYEFNEYFPFALPQGFGLTADGLYCYYSPYEVTPYAYGTTAFVVPYSELGDLLKRK
jgi:hypothetical protein